MNMPLCIFCDNALGPDTKPEHILLSALGGRKTTRRVVCSDCNNRFGGTIDAALAKQVEEIRNLLQLESGTGKPPPTLRNIQTGTETINLRNDGTPELVTPPFTVTGFPDGRDKIEVNARSPEEFRRALPHLAARLRISEARLVELLKQGVIGTIDKRPSRFYLPISLGGDDAIRSATKSCLVLLATVVGNETMKSEAFAAARDFVVKGSEHFSRACVQIDSRDVPNADALKKDYGKFFNLIYVRSDSAGRVIGRFTLYNIISWQIVLADRGGPPDIKVDLVSNPLDPAAWRDSIADILEIPFHWLHVLDRDYELARVRERLISMMKHNHDRSLEVEIRRIVNDSFAKHGVSDSDDFIDPAKLHAICVETDARVAALFMRQPYEETFSAEQRADLFKTETE
jgi:HNH endonuclease